MLKKLIIISCLLSSITLFAQHKDGEELFEDASCMSCHNETDFVPKPEKVYNFKRLQRVVDACRYSNGIEWFDDESLDVSKYLNHKFYKFDETP